MRCCIVVSEVAKARAISRVVRPATLRSVRATRDSGAIAGWQQVKIRRRRSSGMSSSAAQSSSGVGPLSSSSPTDVASRSCRCRRRSRSIARRRAVATIQATGLSGGPSRPQVRSASTHASWTASSARSKSRSCPTSTATARPCDSRIVRSTSRRTPSCRSSLTVRGPASPACCSQTGRISIVPCSAIGIRADTSIAWSRSSQSTR